MSKSTDEENEQNNQADQLMTEEEVVKACKTTFFFSSCSFTLRPFLFFLDFFSTIAVLSPYKKLNTEWNGPLKSLVELSIH